MDGLADMHLMVLPIGTGKSTIISLVPYVLEAESVLILAPSMEIARQLELDFAKDFSNILVKRNVLSLSEFKSIQRRIPKPYVVEKTKDSPNECDKHELVIVNAQKTESQSSFAIESLPKGFDVVIVAEAHHYPAETWQTIENHFVYCKKVFFSASPTSDILINNQQKLTCYEMNRC